MAACRFRVSRVAIERNVRGQEMRRVDLHAVPSDAFLSDDELPDGLTAPEPDGSISLLVSKSFAKKFALGDEFDIVMRERDS